MSSPNSYTTTTLVSNVQLIGHVPLSNSTFTASQIITLADRELQTSLIAQILGTRGGYYLDYEDFDTDGNNNLTEFPIPSQAIGGALANVQIIVSPSIIPVNQIDQSEQFSEIAPTSTTYGYFIRGNTVNVLPAPSIGTVRLWFLRRPNALVATSAAAQITAIASNVITVSSLPATFAVGTVCDLCQDQPTFDVLSNPSITGISSLDVTLDAVPDDLAIGDWLCLENQTPVPQIPVEYRPLLEQRVVVKIYELQGYLEKMNAAMGVLKQMEMDTLKIITPRVQNQTKVINPQNGGVKNNNSRFASYWYTRR